MFSKFLLLSAATVLLFAESCLVESVCYSDADCPPGKSCLGGDCKKLCQTDADCPAGHYCETATGQCPLAECFTHADCQPGFECIGHRCVELGELICPEDMVAIGRLFCMDIYEASRPDASADSFGVDESKAVSQAGVRPWYIGDLSLDTARTACQNAGKRLCRPQEWIPACRGEQDTEYCYGNDYDPVICNSIDAFCHCDQGSTCEDRDPCPFAHCRAECGANFGVRPTGSFPDCVNSWGVFDINGNVWELTDSDDGVRVFRGGAFNCSNSELLHRCDYVGDWGPAAQGFRCCSDGQRVRSRSKK